MPLPQQYIISEAVIKSNQTETELDIHNFIADVNLYESIHKPYISGAISILDDNTMLESMNFRGTETLDLTIEVKDTEFIMKRSFIISSIAKTVTTNDKSVVLVLTLMDIHAFMDSTKKISKAYTGKIEKIISQIIIDELGLGVDTSYTGLYPGLQEEIRVIVPYLSPLQACTWLKARLTTVHGSPFFLSASIFDEKLRLGNFDGMMNATIFNKFAPFIFANSQTNISEEFYDYNNAFVVSNLSQTNDENTYEFIQRGGVSADITVNDIQGGTSVKMHHSIKDMVSRLQEHDILPSSKQIVYDSDAPIYVDNAKQINKVMCSNTYDNYNNYHDAFDQAQVVANVQANSIINALERNKIDIMIPGLTLFAEKVSVGDRLRLNILDTNVENPGQIDYNKSGDYLIMGIRHVFMDTQFNANLTISKLNALEA